jgi:hypothetical protein
MAAAPALKLVLRAAIAHAIRANLLANAQATTLECRRASICRVHVTNGPEFLSSRCMNTLALDQQPAEILVGPFTDAQEVCPASCAVLARNQTD